LASYWDVIDEAVIFDARTASPTEIVRKNETGVLVHDKAAFILLNETIAAAGGQPLTGF
jgi:hypothetical protein